ncbi:MAG TPA: DNA-binding response regulator [Solibacterales bacterium]|nr:DNA-binding response regulator [Bryobacterales bacterium]
MSIRVFLIEPLDLFRQGIIALLAQAPDIQVVGDTGDSAAGELSVIQLAPDVVLLDVGMPGPCSFELARRIRKERPQTQVAFLTAYDDEEYLVESMRVGAGGYILKDASPATLISAVREIAHGNKFLSPRMLAHVVDDFQHRGAHGLPRPRSATLTNREREVVKLLAEGNSVKQIALQLTVSIKTVEAHKCNLMRKLDLHNKVQLVQYAFHQKILRLPPPVADDRFRMMA